MAFRKCPLSSSLPLSLHQPFPRYSTCASDHACPSSQPPLLLGPAAGRSMRDPSAHRPPAVPPLAARALPVTPPATARVSAPRSPPACAHPRLPPPAETHTHTPPARSSNQIGDEGITALARAMVGLHALKKLNLLSVPPQPQPKAGSGRGGAGEGRVQGLGRGRECRGGVWGAASGRCVGPPQVCSCGLVTLSRMGRGA